MGKSEVSELEAKLEDIGGLQQELGNIYDKVNKFPEETKERIRGLEEEEKEEIKRIFEEIERQILEYEDELRKGNDIKTIKDITTGMESSIKELEEAIANKETFLVLKDIKSFAEELGAKIDSIESWLRDCIKENPERIKGKVIEIREAYRRFDELATKLIRDSIKQGISKKIEEISKINPKTSSETLSLQFEEVITGISDIANKLEEITKLSRFEGEIGEIVIKKARAIFENIRGEGDDFRGVSEDIKRKLENFKSSANEINLFIGRVKENLETIKREDVIKLTKSEVEKIREKDIVKFAEEVKRVNSVLYYEIIPKLPKLGDIENYKITEQYESYENIKPSFDEIKSKAIDIENKINALEKAESLKRFVNVLDEVMGGSEEIFKIFKTMKESVTVEIGGKLQGLRKDKGLFEIEIGHRIREIEEKKAALEGERNVNSFLSRYKDVKNDINETERIVEEGIEKWLKGIFGEKEEVEYGEIEEKLSVDRLVGISKRVGINIVLRR